MYLSVYRERENCLRVIGSHDNGDPEVPPSAIYKLETPSYLLTCRREDWKWLIRVPGYFAAGVVPWARFLQVHPPSLQESQRWARKAHHEVHISWLAPCGGVLWRCWGRVHSEALVSRRLQSGVTVCCFHAKVWGALGASLNSMEPGAGVPVCEPSSLVLQYPRRCSKSRTFEALSASMCGGW